MKNLIQNYAFDTALKQITFTDYSSIKLENVLVITNVSTNQIIYNFANPALGGDVLGNILTLNTATTGMTNDDKLQIFYDDGLMAVPENLVEALYDVAQSLQVLNAVRGNLADLRVQLTAANVALTSVTTVVGLQAKGGRVIDISTEPKDLSNLLAMSNINNIQ
jgi:phosphotransferase system HPr-like phosphotransfer protein